MPLNIVLVHPEIPQNTGNIARTCVVTGSTLHLVKPMKFELDEKRIKRAGLDYWPYLDLHVYENIDEFYAKNSGEMWYFSSKTNKRFGDVFYSENCYLVFGSETEGLRSLLDGKEAQAVRIPMVDGQRCLNLSNAVCTAAYEALRQNGYPGLR